MAELSLHINEKKNWHQSQKIRKAVQKSHKKSEKKSSKQDSREQDDNKVKLKEDRVEQRQTIYN